MTERIVPIECRYDTNGRVQVYYIAGPEPTLIDTGGANHPADVIHPALRAQGSDLDQIRTIINTHGHWDHAGGNAAVIDSSGAKVLIHKDGAPLLLDHQQHLDGYFTDTPRFLELPALEADLRANFPTVFGPEHTPDRLLHDGELIDLGAGMTLQVIHVPGHSTDAIALWWEQEGVLFSGDAAQGAGSRPGGAPLYFASIAQARQSIARLREIPFRTLHTSHFFGRLSTPERIAVYNGDDGRAFLSESLEAIDLLEDALRRTMQAHPDFTFPQLAQAVLEPLLASGRWDLVPDPLTGVPGNLAPTLYHLWQDLGTA